ncbi:CvpA family protein [Acidipila sp. EB88]|uniref:CvpA family protein n=1 Tax=Acidipila sp. EB88 TaxID=2305226 RepID=UPI000F602AA3|nr:CvpA family protein [Acidipila sp. EB88]RRA47207.1 CvpA family protein [Acidipila sp. EB88]
MAATDWVIVVILLLCVLQAARRGFFLEAFSLAGIVAGVGVASWNYTRVLPWFTPWLRSAALADAAAFLCIALAVMVGAGLVGRAVRWSVRSIGLGWADRLLGAAFGLVKGAVLVTLGVLLLVAFWPASPWLRDSRLGPYFVAAARGSTVGTPARLRDKVMYGAMLLREHSAPRW